MDLPYKYTSTDNLVQNKITVGINQSRVYAVIKES